MRIRGSTNVEVRLVLFVALVLGLLIPAPIWAQVVGATLSGTVTDPSGAVIPGAQVQVVNTATNVTNTTTTDKSGLYTVPNLTPSTYQVTLTAPGFVTYVRSGITLSVGQEQQLNVKLTVGAVSQKVEVTGAAPTVELTTSSVEGLVTTNQMEELPLNARDWTTLATLQPGVVPALLQMPVGANSIRGSRGIGAQIIISGNKPQLNNYRLDGISDVDATGGAPGSVVGIALGLDSIAEFTAMTANSSAAYGRTAGGVINATEKSGTNAFHGDVYEYLRNSAVDARNYFETSAKKAPFRRSQFGASLGGPIQKNKTFFFFNYEGFRQTLATTNVANVPSPTLRNGTIVNPNGTTSSPGVDPSVALFMTLYPTTCQTLLVVANGMGNICHDTINTTTTGTDNFYTTRIDHTFSSKDTITGTYYYDNGTEKSPDVLNNWIFANISKAHLFGLEETHTSGPSFVNTIRAGYHRLYPISGTTAGIINPASDLPALAAFPGRGAAGYSGPGLTGASGFEGSTMLTYIWNSYQLYDDAFWTKGRSSIRFGVALERDMQEIQDYFGPNGAYTNKTLTSFLTNNPISFRGTYPGGAPLSGDRQTIFGTYIQDDWQVRPTLTLNLGLRYEMSSVPTEAHNQLANLEAPASISNPTLLQQFSSTTVHLGNPYFQNPTYKNFEPRIGFAWDATHDGKTAVRGAFGIFDALPLGYLFTFGEELSAPFAISVAASSLPPHAFPTLGAQIATANIGVVQASPTTVFPGLDYHAIQQDPKRNYIMVYNLNVQRQLTADTSLTIGYVGNHGVHQFESEDEASSTIPTLTPYGLLFPGPAGSATKFYPGGQLFAEWWNGTAKYNALQAQLTKKFSHRFQVQGSYTYGRAIDTGAASGVGDPFVNSISSLTFFCPCRYGPADYNITQTFVANYDWQLPSPKIAGAFGTYMLGGWEMSGVVTLETGLPMSVIMAGDPLGLKNADPWDFPNRVPGCTLTNSGSVQNYINTSCFTPPALPASAPSSLQAQCTPFPGHAGTCENLFGNAGRNSVIGPGLKEWDFSLLKNNYIRRVSESFNIQFQAQFFNILNHPNFQPPTANETIFDASGNPVSGAGALDTTSTTQREIQFALKVIF